MLMRDNTHNTRTRTRTRTLPITNIPVNPAYPTFHHDYAIVATLTVHRVLMPGILFFSHVTNSFTFGRLSRKSLYTKA